MDSDRETGGGADESSPVAPKAEQTSTVAELPGNACANAAVDTQEPARIFTL